LAAGRGVYVNGGFEGRVRPPQNVEKNGPIGNAFDVLRVEAAKRRTSPERTLEFDVLRTRLSPPLRCQPLT